MDEEEALRNYCRRSISVVLNKQQQLKSSKEEMETTGLVLAGHGGCRLPHPDGTNRGTNRTSPGLCTSQGPEVEAALLRLIATLRLKTFNEKLRRAAEVELRDPAVCSDCEQKQSPLALKTFIRRKKTQLQSQTLKGRLNMHMSNGEFTHQESLCKYPKALRCPSLDLGRNYLVEICGSQQPVVALATTKERGVALATDEMRGYPDKNTTGTHLARSRCPFSDR